MLIRSIRRSDVVRRTSCLLSGYNGNATSSLITKTTMASSSSSSSSSSSPSSSSSGGGLSMLPTTFEERVFFPNKTTTNGTAATAQKQHFATASVYERPKLQTPQNSSNSHHEEQEYEDAIRALNTLQSNAATIRRSIAMNNKQIPLNDTVKYLQRSGMSLEQLDKLSFIHVSGTKGKGSTCALAECILRTHGYKTGFFSSPHLVSVTERIRIDGLPITKAKFTRAFWRVFQRLQAAQETPNDMPVYFKFLTILCFHIFLEEQVDVGVLEVGIGGELDCTNVVRNTKTVGISSLGLEHTQLLGDTLSEIAWQKAGIIKPNANVYTSVSQPECLEVIEQRARALNATLHIVPEFSKYFEDGNSQTILESLNNVTKLNGSLAIQLANDWLRNQKSRELNGHGTNANETQLSEKVLEALSSCSWPGRCQIVKFFNFNIHLDGAHTVESMYVCSDWFDEVVEKSSNPKILIFNTTGDRDSKKLLDILRRRSKFSVACFVPNIASGSANNNDNTSVYGISSQIKRAKMHAGLWHLLCAEASEADNSNVFGSIVDSFNYVRERYGETQELDVLVTGSLHLIGATVLALNEFKRRLDQTT